jgi:hypothetical protein
MLQSRVTLESGFGNMQANLELVWVGERGWSSQVRAGFHGMSFWKFISKEWHRFSSHIRLIPSDGSIINFWREVWCRSSPFLEVFPRLYSLASNKEAFIVDNFDSLTRSHQWNVSFMHSLNDWEVEDLASFYSLLYSYNLGGKVDKIWWFPNRNGKFEARSFYNILISNVSFPFPWKSIWCTKAPPMVVFFVWSTTLGNILNLHILRNPLIICFFIVSMLNSYGMHFSIVLAWHGLYLMGL